MTRAALIERALLAAVVGFIVALVVVVGRASAGPTPLVPPQPTPNPTWSAHAR
jgi:hypothetical protein